MNIPFDYKLFGLEPRDLRLYEAMLSAGEALSIRTLAARTGMNRGTTFEVMKKLIQVGLVSTQHKSTRKIYIANQPDALVQYASSHSRSVNDGLVDVERYVSHLHQIQVEPPFNRFSQLFEGEDEVARLLHSILDEVETMTDKSYRVVSSSEVSNHLYRKFETFTRQRVKRGIRVRVIGIGGVDSLAPLAERKWLSPATLPASYLIVYGEKVAQITLSQAYNVQGTVIHDAGIAQLQALLFDTIWQTL